MLRKIPAKTFFELFVADLIIYHIIIAFLFNLKNVQFLDVIVFIEWSEVCKTFTDLSQVSQLCG